MFYQSRRFLIDLKGNVILITFLFMRISDEKGNNPIPALFKTYSHINFRFLVTKGRIRNEIGNNKINLRNAKDWNCLLNKPYSSSLICVENMK